MQAYQNPEKVSPVNIYRNCGDAFGSQAYKTSKHVEEATANHCRVHASAKALQNTFFLKALKTSSNGSQLSKYKITKQEGKTNHRTSIRNDMK